MLSYFIGWWLISRFRLHRTFIWFSTIFLNSSSYFGVFFFWLACWLAGWLAGTVEFYVWSQTARHSFLGRCHFVNLCKHLCHILSHHTTPSWYNQHRQGQLYYTNCVGTKLVIKSTHVSPLLLFLWWLWNQRIPNASFDFIHNRDMRFFFLFLPVSSFSFFFLFMHIRNEIRMRRNYVKLDDWHISIKKKHSTICCYCACVARCMKSQFGS